MKLYGPPVTPNYHRVAMILNEVGITDIEHIPVDLLKREQKQEWFLEINPFGKIPVLVDGDLTLRESRSICRYLLEKYAPETAEKLLGSTPEERSLVNQWLDFEGQMFHPTGAAIGQEVYLKKIMGAPRDEQRLAENVQKLGETLDVYEKILGEEGSGGFLACARLTLADLTHAPVLSLIPDSGYLELIESRPNVAKWWSNINAWHSWQKVQQGPSLQKLAAAKQEG